MDTILVIAATIMIFLGFWELRSFVKDVLHRSAVAGELVDVLASDHRINAALGWPVTRSGAATGSVHPTSDGLRALLAIPIAGSIARGTLYVNALRSTDWQFESVTLHLHPRRIELALHAKEMM